MGRGEGGRLSGMEDIEGEGGRWLGWGGRGSGICSAEEGGGGWDVVGGWGVLVGVLGGVKQWGVRKVKC